MVDPKPAPLARIAPKERVDTGATDPSDYVPSVKEAPTPVESAPGLDAVELPEIGTVTRPARPSKATVANAVKSVKSVAASVGETANKVKQALASTEIRDLAKRIDDKDKRRMKGVKRYSKDTVALFNSVVRSAFIAQGVTNVSPDDVASAVDALSELKTPVGFRVTKRGELKRREVSVTEVPAYLLGSVALNAEEAAAKQWINHPTLFDVGVTIVATANVVTSVMDPTSPIGQAMARIIEAHKADRGEPIKAEAAITDARNIVEEPSE